ncbi:adenine nucleotide alpha hydrolases-like protein [Xylariaceae sp. FL0255]|nr:adenine nucleotide alpha hydrolases-like protein [Xylariaceae sp. FL0255]
MASRKPMSLEAALEEERKEIENLISMQSMQTASRRAPSVGGPRSPSPYVNPRSPVRSMLDIGDEPKSPPAQAPVRSMLDISSPPPPRQPPRSMLDIDSAVPAPSSTHTSPTLSFKPPVINNTNRHRSASDAASKPIPDIGLRSPPLVGPRNNDLTSAYKFHDILPTNVGQAMPPAKRGSASTGAKASSIGEALRGADLSNLVLPGESSRSFFGRKNNKSKSPNNRFAMRSSSPFGAASRRNQSQGSYMLDSGEIVDMNTAYRRLSDANLVYGGSSLAPLALKKLDYSDGNGRIAKDNLSPYGELLPDESDDDVANSSDEENHRGRKMTSRADSDDEHSTERGAKSLLAAVEDERKQVSAVQPQYRSLFDDPAITITSPTGEKSRAKTKKTVQPATSFDQEPISGTQTPFDPELDADVNAIKFAQKMQLSLTPIISTPEVHRSIRLIYRGEYPTIQREAEEEHRRLRKYLVATDLSDESTHALEWAIGTVLRDGDTLIAMYCLDEETSGSIDAGNLVPDDPRAMKEQAVAIHAMTKTTGARTSGGASAFAFGRPSNSPLLRAADAGSATSSPTPGSRNKSKLEEERECAVLDITERVSKLLRKTQLQVRVIVEVIHCKNPKHLITEVIDIVNPTLVILGSRGRSALKGTLLGSFSNYLVTKSSVPVMVARKRLRKKSKYQPPPMKQVNNLANPSARSLEMARID